MSKYRILIETKADGSTAYHPQRKGIIFWSNLKEHTAYDSWPIVCCSMEEAVKVINDYKIFEAGKVVTSVCIKEID